MGNSTMVTRASTRDSTVWNMTAEYCDFKTGNDILVVNPHVAHCKLISGEQPSIAFAPFPARGLLTDEIAPNIALQSDGPAGQIKPRTRARITYSGANNSGYGNHNSSTILFNGTVVQLMHDFGDDSCTAEIFGDQFLLSKIIVFGRVVYDPISKTYYFDSTTKTIFNLDGWADCLDTPAGMPLFAPSRRFGWPADSAGEIYQEPPVGYANLMARTWQVADAIKYLRNWCSPSLPPLANVPGNLYLSSWIVWPDGAGNVFQTGAKRVLRNIDVDSLTMDRALTVLCRRAGAWNLYLEPAPDFKSTVRFINMAPAQSTSPAHNLYVPGFSADMDEYTTNGNTIQKGYMRESCANYYDDVSIVAPGIIGEKTCATTSAYFSGTVKKMVGKGLLQIAWSQDDQTAFNKFVHDNGNTEAAFKAACKCWPFVYCAYRTRGDFFANTKWAAIGQPGPYARIRPYLLSGSNQSAATQPRDWTPRDIVVEIANNNSADPLGTTPISEFASLIRQDGLELSPDGQMILLPALRDIGKTWRSSGASTYAGLGMYPQCVRLTIAAYGHTPIVGRNASDPNNVGDRIGAAKINDQWTYWATNPLEAEEYVDEVRYDSWPEGVELATMATDRATLGNELFTDLGDPADPNDTLFRLPAHAFKRITDVKRLNQGGELFSPWYEPSLVPGSVVSVGGLANNIPNRSVLQSVELNSGTNLVTYELGAPELQTIYDAPASFAPPNLATGIQHQQLLPTGAPPSAGNINRERPLSLLENSHMRLSHE